jgi:hypothetical protein
MLSVVVGYPDKKNSAEMRLLLYWMYAMLFQHDNQGGPMRMVQGQSFHQVETAQTAAAILAEGSKDGLKTELMETAQVGIACRVGEGARIARH